MVLPRGTYFTFAFRHGERIPSRRGPIRIPVHRASGTESLPGTGARGGGLVVSPGRIGGPPGHPLPPGSTPVERDYAASKASFSGGEDAVRMVSVAPSVSKVEDSPRIIRKALSWVSRTFPQLMRVETRSETVMEEPLVV